MALKLNSDERARIAEKIMEVGNLVFVALAVGQILSRDIDLVIAFGGVSAFVLAYFIAYQIMKRR